MAALALAFALASCGPVPTLIAATPELIVPTATPVIQLTPYPTRPPYQPGELVDYIAQPGDTLPALAKHFNTTESEIRAANPIIPNDATSMPPGFPMKIPIYYLPLWGNPYQIIPDSLYINGPSQVGFDTSAFVAQHPGWLNGYLEYAGEANRSGAQVVDLVATNFSISPRFLLAILEYESGALSNPKKPDTDYVLGHESFLHKGVYLQLVWAANTLNNAYYDWRTGALTEFEHPDGRLERPDPWQNAASAALQFYFSRQFDARRYALATGPDGFAKTYAGLFGDPWQDVTPHIPGSLQQPNFMLPFPSGKTWNFTGGPHSGWGDGPPLAAIDFAPSGVSACGSTNEWATAMADGVVARIDKGVVVEDLDGDGDERTGWVIFYLHLAANDKVHLGAQLKTGDPIGHPSCEGGESTGTHLHLARKYNGEWMSADFAIPFNLEGWVVHNGDRPYLGTLVRFSQVITASDKSELGSQITAGK